MKILSLCTSAGLWDRAFIEAGHEVVPGCEIMPHKRAMYAEFCGGEHLAHDLVDLPEKVRGLRFDGVIGGIPCQSRSKLRAIRPNPKFGDLLEPLLDVLAACTWDWAVLENVTALDVPGFKTARLNAMHYAAPHQSRERWFTFSRNLSAPPPLYSGDVDDLMAYSVVAGRIYGPKRGSKLQGWPEFMSLAGKFPCVQMQEALADGVPRGLADAWIRQVAHPEPPPAVRLGAIAYKNTDGEWTTAEPHDLMYSTVTMSATHVWDGKWRPIFDEVAA